MTAPNGFLSSDDELFVDKATADPLPFTFQSDLSDDDDDADADPDPDPDADHHLPDPLLLDHIATATLATLDGPLEGLAAPAEDTHHRGVRTNGVAAAPEDKKDKPRIGVSPVQIEVCLPWLPPAQRAAYQRVHDDDYWPEEGERLGKRRRRRAVSRFPRLACSLVFPRLFCFGHEAVEVGSGTTELEDWRAGIPDGNKGVSRAPVSKPLGVLRCRWKGKLRETGLEPKFPAERALPLVPISKPELPPHHSLSISLPHALPWFPALLFWRNLRA
jgi:hypothetical protein